MPNLSVPEQEPRLEPTLDKDTVNQRLLRMEYAVRGPILERAEEIERELAKGVPKPFRRVLRANLGDPQAAGRSPITFIRQVVSLAACPALLPTADVPPDVTRRVRDVLAGCANESVGAYSSSQGLLSVRRDAARFLHARDGAPACAEAVFLGNGATDLIESLLELFVQRVDGKPPGIMLPVPQYPVFSGLLAQLGLRQVDYYLDEGQQWALTRAALEEAWHSAAPAVNVRAIVIINPGNPTGHVLSRQHMEEVLRFAHEHRLFVIADEVYQENVFSKPFFSFKRVSTEMGEPYCQLELASVLSLSKGWAAEGGLRGGMLELRGVDPVVLKALGKTRALRQSPNTLGQVALSCVLRPPAPGQPSFPLFDSERRQALSALRDRARLVCAGLRAIPGYSCNEIDGALFAFPSLELPERARLAALDRGLRPDELYCLLLLEETGICVVPGSGFGEAPGSAHLRLTVTHPRAELRAMLRAMHDFHIGFLRTYSDHHHYV